MHRLDPEAIIGLPIEELDTPALLVDLEAFEHNLATMAAFFAGRPAGLRPHAKTHKCPEIARRQLAAGAVGVTCAKLAEAEVMAAAGIDDILIANQMVGPAKTARLVELAARVRVAVAVDDAANIAALSEAVRRCGVTIRVLVEVNIGMDRCGVQPGPAALPLARQIAAAPGLEFAGLQGYEGHLVTIKDPQERRTKVEAALAPLLETKALLEQAGLPVPTISGGGTGTYDITGNYPGITEVQAGSYVFMDATYRQVRPEFRPALSLLASVVSRPQPERLITDAGLKALSSEFGLPQILDVPGATLARLSEEHGKVTLAEPERVSLRPGDKVRLVPSHCCTTVNLYDHLVVVKRGVVVDVWPVAARGCSQ